MHAVLVSVQKGSAHIGLGLLLLRLSVVYTLLRQVQGLRVGDSRNPVGVQQGLRVGYSRNPVGVQQGAEHFHKEPAFFALSLNL